MNDKELVFYKKNLAGGWLFAARRTGSAIMFDSEKQEWRFSFHNYHQLEMDSIYDGFEDITPEEAKEIYKDIIPDEKLLDKLDELKGRR